MNNFFQLCPQCNKHINIVLNQENIHINCKCGYFSIKNVNNIMNDIHQVNHYKYKIFSCIINDIKKGNEHLLTYFKTLKNHYINQLNSQINEIESSYEDSYNRNMNMLSFIKLLIDNYDGTIEMKETIMKSTINIYQCKENVNVDDVIKYYNEYNIIKNKKKEINIKDIKCVKTITGHTSSVFSLILLKDKRIASCSADNTIRIYDPSIDCCCDEIIKRHSNGIESICELDDGTIVSCAWNNSIMIGDYTIKNAHYNNILKVITLPNNRIASCSMDFTIKIWKSNLPYSNTPIKVLEGHRDWVTSLLYIKERDMMISGSDDDTLRLWNMSTYQCENIIKEVDSCSLNSLYQIDKDRVIVGGYNIFTIVNIDKCKIEKTIKDEAFGFV